MSDAGAATFSSPSTPTGGLQPYDLERGVKRLYAGTAARLALRNRRRRVMKKENSMSQPETFGAMVDTLAKSVTGILAANPENRDELLTKSFGEFKDAAATEISTAIEAVEKSAEAEEPMFKGLGTVGRVANLLSMVANQVENIKSGQDYKGQDGDADPASEDVSDLLDHMVAMAELSLRAAVNEHVDLSDDDELSDDDVEKGMILVSVPNATDAEKTLLVKTALPEQLAKFATDPAAVGSMAIQTGAGLLLAAGVPEGDLQKMFGVEGVRGEALAKGVPPQFQKKDDKQQDPSGQAADQGSSDAPPAGTPDPSQDPNAQGAGPDQGQPDDGQDDPLDVLGRLLAAAMIQLDHIQQMVQQASGGDQGADQGQPPAQADDAAAATADPSQEPDPKPPSAARKDASEQDDLQKAETPELLALRKKLADAEAAVAAKALELKKVLDTPQAAKAVLAKSVDLTVPGGGSEDAGLVKLATELDGAKTEADRRHVLAKAAFKLPGVDLTAVANRLAKAK